jgi:prepilin-type N-terminal cleavage/methylation domain-containing protein
MKYFGNQGFSLLEVMIALAIFSISIVALYGIQTQSIHQNYTASRITTADSWASKKIEDLIALKYEDVDDDSQPSPESPIGVYTISWNVVTDAPLPDTKTIRIVVTSSRAGVGKQVDLEYIKTDKKI